ncbi:MAG: hypothetical protein ABI220_03965 [Candidatus Saccharimonadales bacterium]
MSRQKVGQEKIRSIQKSSGSYLVSIPIELMRGLYWQERQRVTITRSGQKLIITDYKG